MAGSLNKVMLIGNLGQDPELRYTPTGIATTSFSIATSRAWTTPEGEAREETEWHNVVTWRKLAETCGQYLAKGRKVYVEGRLQTRSWEAKDGAKRSRTEIVAFQVQFLSSAPENNQDNQGEPDGEELPF